MIRISDLRIGNIVFDKQSKKEIEVEGICYNGINPSVDYGALCADLREEEIDGILITEGKLMSFGFSDTNYDQLYAIQINGRGYVIVKHDKSTWALDTRYKLQFVHNLQNLIYAITGTELRTQS